MTHAVRPEDLVGAVLARDLALIDVFVRLAPQFEKKLRNPVVRHTMARLVTIEQAAGIAGVPVNALVRDLNAALGLQVTAAPATPAEAPMAAPHDGGGSQGRGMHRPPAGLREVDLDLRADLREGREPFGRIMRAVGTLRDEEVLHLRTTFEPLPLYSVLGRRGLLHAAEAHAADDWSVWFWRGSDELLPEPENAPTESPPAAAEQWLDVRGLEPPEPMVRTLAALEALPAGTTLIQVNVRVPQFLLPLLGERGFVGDVDASDPGRVLVRIRRADRR